MRRPTNRYDCGVAIMDEPAQVIVINDRVRIPYVELQFRYTRSSGPGGQHTNKTETSVELLFDLANTTSLSNAERSLARQRLTTYVDSAGMLHLESQTERSQLRNRQEVTDRFVKLLRRALVPVRKRKATRPSRAAYERRLEHKHKTAVVKRNRQSPALD